MCVNGTNTTISVFYCPGNCCIYSKNIQQVFCILGKRVIVFNKSLLSIMYSSFNWFLDAKSNSAFMISWFHNFMYILFEKEFVVKNNGAKKVKLTEHYQNWTLNLTQKWPVLLPDILSLPNISHHFSSFRIISSWFTHLRLIAQTN